jgi:Kef-type K+ transport system membrane component KefB
VYLHMSSQVTSLIEESLASSEWAMQFFIIVLLFQALDIWVWVTMILSLAEDNSSLVQFQFYYIYWIFIFILHTFISSWVRLLSKSSDSKSCSSTWIKFTLLHYKVKRDNRLVTYMVKLILKNSVTLYNLTLKKPIITLELWTD